MKAGWKTTEFWVAIIAAAATVVGVLAGLLTPQWAAICVAVEAGLYIISRGLAKYGATTAGLIAIASELAPLVKAVVEKWPTTQALPMATLEVTTKDTKVNGQ